MNKKPRPSKKRKGASIGIVICFVAAIIMVGTYTLRSHQEVKKQQELAMAEEEAKDDTNDDLTGTRKEAGSDYIINSAEDDLRETEGTALSEKEDADGEEEEKTEENSAPVQDYTPAETAGGARTVSFTEDSRLLWPVDGNVLMNYNMDKTVYFSTLDQYKYNPAMIISGSEGDQVICGAAGTVKSIDNSAETGTTVNIDLGNGYELFYGQLKDVTVKTGDYVAAKTVLGYVAQPTKYYSVEGTNVYFEMRKDGQPIDPLNYMAE